MLVTGWQMGPLTGPSDRADQEEKDTPDCQESVRHIFTKWLAKTENGANHLIDPITYSEPTN